MEGNFSNRVQDVIRLSREEALRLGHDYIGAEHLLLGLIREGEGIGARILKNLRIDRTKHTHHWRLMPIITLHFFIMACLSC